jgi:hypothetical protein
LQAQQRRTVLLQCRERAQQLLLAVLKQAAQKGQRLVTEQRRIEGGEEVISRSVRELPIDAEWLKAARRLVGDIVRIDTKLGPDVDSSLNMREADALLAELAGSGNEGEMGRVGKGEPEWEPNEEAGYSSCSKVKGCLGPNRTAISATDGDASLNAEDVCDELLAYEENKITSEKNEQRKVFCGPAEATLPAGDMPPQTAQIANAKLPPELRERRRRRFLQSSSEPGVDTKRLVRIPSWSKKPD